MDPLHLAKTLLRDHEGLRLTMYKCPAGFNTIGYGYNMEANPMPLEMLDRLRAVGNITLADAEDLLHDQTIFALDGCQAYSYWWDLDEWRQAALIDLCYCLGRNGFSKFVKMHEALSNGDYATAADELMDSKFATQTGRRAVNLEKLVRHGNPDNVESCENEHTG